VTAAVLTAALPAPAAAGAAQGFSKQRRRHHLVPEEETKTETLLPKAVRSLTPGETVEAFWTAILNDDYPNAVKYMDVSGSENSFFGLMKQDFPYKSPEEVLYYFFSVEPKKQKVQYGKINILKEYPAEVKVKKWSKEYGKLVEYETMSVDLEFFYTKNGKEKIEKPTWRLIKINGVWKIS
jgi:hypothetical protein